jgi:sensor domain CHASE-containing protein
MSIRTKVILVLGSVVLVYLVLSFVVLRAFVYPAFDDLEDEQAAHNLTRIEHALNENVEHLDSINLEYSQWTQTHNFLLGSNERFAAEELEIFEHERAGVDAVFLCDLNGDIVWEGARDPETGERFTVTPLFEPPLRSIDLLIARISKRDGASGLLRTQRGPALLAARSVYDSTGVGPTSGYLIFLRMLDTARLDALRQQTQVDFDVAMEASDAASSSRARKDVRAPLDGAGEDHRLTDAWLPDIYGDRAFQMLVRTPRHITAIGTRAILLSLVSLVLGGFIVTLAVWIVLQRMIITPIGNLTRSMLSVAKEIGEAKPPTAYRKPAAGARG